MTLKVGTFNAIAQELLILEDALKNKETKAALASCETLLKKIDAISDRAQLTHQKNQTRRLLRSDIEFIQGHLASDVKVDAGLAKAHLVSFARQCIGNFSLPQTIPPGKRKPDEKPPVPEPKRQLTKSPEKVQGIQGNSKAFG